MTWPLPQPRDNTYWNFLEGIFTDAELDQIIEQCLALTPEPGNIGAGFRTSTIAWVPTDNPEYNWIYERLATAVTDINQSYYRFDLTHIQPLQFTTYTKETEGRYKPHIDLGQAGAGRKLSFSLQLSDPFHHEGGSLQFLHLKNEPELAPRARGKIIFFPSFLTHEVTPVTQGVRYSLVGWIAGPPFK